jgi:hypothetical protein
LLTRSNISNVWSLQSNSISATIKPISAELE